MEFVFDFALFQSQALSKIFKIFLNGLDIYTGQPTGNAKNDFISFAVMQVASTALSISSMV